MARFCKALSKSYQLPGYKLLSNTILDQQYLDVMQALKKDLEDLETCAITTDGWTSPQRFGYMSLTVHFIDNTFRLKSRTLTIENITGSHTGEALQACIREQLTKWNLTKNVEGITTDNGKNYHQKSLLQFSFKKNKLVNFKF